MLDKPIHLEPVPDETPEAPCQPTATAASTLLRFGGRRLRVGRTTWYDTPTAGGKYAQVCVRPGAIVSAGLVMRYVGHEEVDEDGSPGKAILDPNAEYYIKAGMARYITQEEADEQRKREQDEAAGE